MDRLRPVRHCQNCAACNSRLASVFAKMSRESLERLNRSKVTNYYRRGQSLHYEGNPCSSIWCIRSGLAKIYKSAPHSRSYILHLAGPGDLLGLETLITGTVHGTTAEMLEDGVVCQIERSELVAVVQYEPRVQRAILRTVAQQLAASEEERAELAAGEVRERLALTLLTLADKYGDAAGPTIRLAVNLSREDLADMIGATTETAIRHLSELRKKKVLLTEGREIVIQDPSRLARIARVPIAPVEGAAAARPEERGLPQI